MFFYCDGLAENVTAWVDEEYGLVAGRYKKPFMKADCLAHGGEWVNQNAHFDMVLGRNTAFGI